MSKFIDLTGLKFNMLTVKERDFTKKKTYWICQCDCGKTTSVESSNLKNGLVKSCGCLKHTPWNKTHGESNTKLYRHWVCMMRRCYDENYHSYKYYGARGIEVCKEWHNYEAFKTWTLLTRADESLTCERKDYNGDYCPENCTWIPLSEQANNRRSCIMITYQDKTQNLMQWCKELKLSYPKIYTRMYRNKMTFEEAIKIPVEQSRKE